MTPIVALVIELTTDRMVRFLACSRPDGATDMTTNGELMTTSAQKLEVHR